MAKEGVIQKYGKHDRQRLFPGVRGAAPHNRTNMINDAQERAAHWAKLTPQEQLSDLDRRLGKGAGAQKQRAKIRARIDAARSAPTEAPAAGKDLHVKAKDRRAAERAERPGR